MIRAGKRFRDRRLSPSGRGGTAPGSERFPGRGGLGNSDLCWYPGVIGFGGVTVREAVEWEALLPA